MTPASEILEFGADLTRNLPAAKVSFDAPASEAGTWWIDISHKGHSIPVSWRRGFGFGVFSSEEGYGDKPDERYADPHKASCRVVALAGKAAGSPRQMWLREVRSLVGVQQTSLAEELDVNQAAISRLENRDDVKLSTLLAYIEALGGTVEMRVRFEDFEAAIARPASKLVEEL